MFSYLIMGMVFAFAAAVQPGPLQAYLISQSLTYGWRKTIIAACAPLLSDGPIIAVVLILLAHISLWFIRILQGIGGIFLLVLAFKAFRNWKFYEERKDIPLHSGKQSLLHATVVNLMNPNAYLGWSLVMGPLFLRGWQESPSNGIVLLLGFYGAMITCTAGIIILFGSAKKIGNRINRTLIALSSAGLLGFGLYQLWLSAGT